MELGETWLGWIGPIKATWFRHVLFLAQPVVQEWRKPGWSTKPYGRAAQPRKRRPPSAGDSDGRSRVHPRPLASGWMVITHGWRLLVTATDPDHEPLPPRADCEHACMSILEASLVRPRIRQSSTGSQKPHQCFLHVGSTRLDTRVRSGVDLGMHDGQKGIPAEIFFEYSNIFICTW